MPQVDCAHFNGSKPCGKNQKCDSTCSSFAKRGSQILFIHLGALGAVVRSTALLNPIKEKYPNCQITWVTMSPAHHLLKGHPDIHRVLTLNEVDMLTLSVLQFDAAFILDKSIEATGILMKTRARAIFGFIADPNGVIRTANESSRELWELGLDDERKFFQNKKTELQLMMEALELSGPISDYNLPLTANEKDVVFERREKWRSSNGQVLIGLNTGCAATIAAKKLSVDNHRELIRKLQKNQNFQIVLLGGPEDTIRNAQIAEGFKDIIQSPTTLGLRDGLVSVAACDVVITGDSLGMHMAISQKKLVVAWFGPTCAHEIELYGRGEKILSQAPCGPCWKRSCHKPVMCYDLVNLDEIIHAVDRSIHIHAPELITQFSDTNGLFRGSSLSGATFDLDEETLSDNATGAHLP